MTTKHIVFAGLVGALMIALGGLLMMARDSDAARPAATPAARVTEEPAAPAPVTAPSPRTQVTAPAVPATTASNPTPPPARPTGAERGQQLAAKLRDSGAASGAWTATARDVATRLSLGNLECHADGCLAEATYADELAFETADESVTNSEAFKSYPGWRHRSIRKDGDRIVATWFFMKP